MTRATAEPGLLLGGRYRLGHQVAHGPASVLWRATDDVLSRPVAVKVLTDGARNAAFLDAARRAGTLTHPRIARVDDATTERGLCYVVSEWVSGHSLLDLLRDGPLPAARATTLIAQVAEVCVYAHNAATPHLDLDAGNVMLTGDGSVKVTDLAVGAAVRGFHVVDGPAFDTTALGALLYACLTGHSALGAEPGLPRAPRHGGRVVPPRALRGDVPRALDDVVLRVLRPDLERGAPIRSPSDLLAALAALPGDLGTPIRQAARVRPAPRTWRRRLVRIGFPSLAVVGVGCASALVGVLIGTVPRDPSRTFPGLGPTPSAVGVAPELGITVPPAAVRDFDPPPGDGKESPIEVPLAYDGEPATAWRTTTYLRTARFGGLKDGVGLLVDLGAPVNVRRLDLEFGRAGVSVELRAAGAPGSNAAAFAVVAAVDKADTRVTLRPPPGTPPQRYWLIWITRLVPTDGGKFAAAIAEFRFAR